MSDAIDDPVIERRTTAYPWNTGPSGQGAAECAWCGRTIYAPAVPCSVAPIAGLAEMATAPGLGDRCKYEVTTRTGR